MDPSCLVLTAAAGVMVWGMTSCQTLGPLNMKWPSFECHIHWLHECDNELSPLQWLPQTQALNLIVHIWYVVKWRFVA